MPIKKLFETGDHVVHLDGRKGVVVRPSRESTTTVKFPLHWRDSVILNAFLNIDTESES